MMEYKLQTGIPACKKLDLIHTMLVGHEGRSNDSLLGIWQMGRKNEPGLHVELQCHRS